MENRVSQKLSVWRGNTLYKCHKLAGRFSKPKFAAEPYILYLPFEILLMIAEELYECPGSITSLAVTCKSLFVAYSQHISRMDRATRAGWLNMLEKELGQTHYYCPICQMLRRYEKNTQCPDSARHRCYLKYGALVFGKGKEYSPCSM